MQCKVPYFVFAGCFCGYPEISGMQVGRSTDLRVTATWQFGMKGGKVV